MKNRVGCSRKGGQFGEWVNSYTDIRPSGNGFIRVETHRDDPLEDGDPCVLLFTPEDAGRLGAFLLAAAVSEG